MEQHMKSNDYRKKHEIIQKQQKNNLFENDRNHMKSTHEANM